MPRKLIAFPYYGGKNRLLRYILPHIPEDITHFLDVFGGSASVILNAPKVRTMTYNDINTDVVNFFKQLRDNSDELIRQLKLTPHSRKELEICREILPQGENDMEKARRFYVRARQGYAALSTQTRKDGKNAAQWSYIKHCKGHAASTYKNGVDKLWDIVERLRYIQIEERPALEVIKNYDKESTFMYCDPPYVMSTRSAGNAYKYEMDEKEHMKLGGVISNCKSKVMVSGYRSNLYDSMFKDWNRIDFEPTVSKAAHALRQESIWTNY